MFFQFNAYYVLFTDPILFTRSTFFVPHFLFHIFHSYFTEKAAKSVDQWLVFITSHPEEIMHAYGIMENEFESMTKDDILKLDPQVMYTHLEDKTPQFADIFVSHKL